LRRELEEEIGMTRASATKVARIQHVYRRGNVVEVAVFFCSGISGKIENRIFSDVQWVERTKLPDMISRCGPAVGERIWRAGNIL